MEASSFDLLQGHDFGDAALVNRASEEPNGEEVLVWSKIHTSGHQPAAREGHTAVSIRQTVLVFGGHEAGTRVNSTLLLDAPASKWSLLSCSGTVPPARIHHAACASRTHMFIHGGEGHASANTAIENSCKSASSCSVDKPTVNRSGKDVIQDAQQNSRENTNASSTEEVPNHNPLYVPGPLKGVSMGDNIATKISTLKLNKTADSEQRNRPAPKVSCSIQCFDDFYALNIATKKWIQIHCSLAPLPRKGHSLNMCTVQGLEYFVLFGGYSNENIALSNTVQVCDVNHVHNYCVTADSPSSKQKKAICWRTLSCRGTPPVPRYRHSCTIIDGDGVNNLMVIMGGIGKDPKTALCDTHILDLNTLQWCTIRGGSNALALGTAGFGPSAGIYGHCAFPVYRGGLLPDAVAAEEAATLNAVGSSVVAATKIRMAAQVQIELIIYGGSSNTHSAKSNCYQNLYAFDIMEHQWRKVSTGYSFPPARNNFSCAVVQNWSPLNEVPSAQARHLQFGASQYVAHTNGCAPPTAAIIFGGLTAVGNVTDTWILDLLWRPLGVEEYDSSAKKQAQIALDQQSIKKCASKLELAYLHKSGLTAKPIQQQQQQHLQQSSLVDERSSEISREGALAFLLGEYNMTLSNKLDMIKDQLQLTSEEMHDLEQHQQQSGDSGTQHLAAILANHNRKYKVTGSPNCAKGGNGVASMGGNYRDCDHLNFHVSKSEPTLKTALTGGIMYTCSSPEGSGVDGEERAGTGEDFMLSGSHIPNNVSSIKKKLISLITHTKQYQEEMQLVTQKGLKQNTFTAENESSGGGRGRADTRHDAEYGGSHDQPHVHDFRRSSSSSGGGLSHDADVGKAFLKVRKERAQADLQLQRERDRAILAETALQSTMMELESTRAELATLQDQFAKTTDELRFALEQSLQRERKLQGVNDEANQLLILSGLNSLQTAK